MEALPEDSMQSLEESEIMSDKLPSGRKNNSRYVGWKAQDILDHKKALKKKWAEDNVEKMRIYRKAHYEKHRDKILHRKRAQGEPRFPLPLLIDESVAVGEPSGELVTCTLDIPSFSAEEGNQVINEPYPPSLSIEEKPMNETSSTTAITAEVELGDSKRSEYKEEKSDSYGLGLNINHKRKTDPSDAFTLAFRGDKRMREPRFPYPPL